MFRDRTEAGRRLAQLLDERKHELDLDAEDVVIVGLPRGGVPVACEVAAHLGAPLDVIMVRKLGVPFQPEVAMGAICEGDVRFVNADLLREAGISDAQVARVEERERFELTRRAAHYRSGHQRIPLAGKVVVIVDDGIATGSTARVACRFARAEGASKVILAVPVAPRDWAARLGDDADHLIAVREPARFRAVGQYYRDFGETTDDDVIAALGRVRH